MLWACQLVAFMISARVAPLARAIIFKIFAPLLSGCSEVVFFARAGLKTFLRAFASFFGAAALALAPLAAFRPVGAPFFRVAPFFKEAVSGATFAPGAAAAAVFSVVVPAVSLIFLLVPFCAWLGA